MTAKCYPKQDGLCMSKLAKVPLLWKLHCHDCRHVTEDTSLGNNNIGGKTDDK